MNFTHHFLQVRKTEALVEIADAKYCLNLVGRVILGMAGHGVGQRGDGSRLAIATSDRAVFFEKLDSLAPFPWTRPQRLDNLKRGRLDHPLEKQDMLIRGRVLPGVPLPGRLPGQLSEMIQVIELVVKHRHRHAVHRLAR